jgi:hypothetical protein
MKSFLSAILPSQGIYFIASIKAGRCRNHACHSFDEMVQKAHELDTQGFDTFFACASYQKESYIGDDGKRHQRTKDNSGWVRSFWLDIDCGADKVRNEKGYAIVPDAGGALQEFVDALGLPKPTVVFSGGGLHVYFLLAEVVTKEQWQPVAQQLKDLTRCPAIRLLADDSRTSDIASILRPVGTHNYKPERNGAVVQLVSEGIPIDFDAISQIIGKAHQTHCGANTGPSKAIQLGTVHAPDPETPENVARLKSALAAIDPDSEYPIWRDILFAIHSTGWVSAEEIARSWSRGDLI